MSGVGASSVLIPLGLWRRYGQADGSGPRQDRLALRAWPAVADSGWTALGEGQLSQAVLVAPDVVVRSPAMPWAARTCAPSSWSCRSSSPTPTSPLPTPLHAELDRSNGLAVAAHRFVPGTVLERDVVEEMPDRVFDALATQLSAFLAGLRGRRRLQLPSGWSPRRSPSRGRRSRRRWPTLLRAHLSPFGAARAAAELRVFAAVGGNDIALCHTDLGGNLVWDVHRRRLGLSTSAPLGGAIPPWTWRASSR